MKDKNDNKVNEKKTDPGKYSERFEALFKYASIGILLADAEGNIVMINDFALKQFGYTSIELEGKKVEILIPNRFHLNHTAYRTAYLSHPVNRPMGIGRDLHGIKKDGSEIPVEVSLSHYENDEGSFVIAFVTDITERVNAREQIMQLNNELENTVAIRTLELTETLHKLEISKEEQGKVLKKEKELGELKSRFISIASHEFRTPLSTIRSSIYLINKYEEAAEQIKREKHVQRIISSVNILTDILNDFLSLGKIEEGKMHVNIQQTNLKQLMDTIIDEHENILHPSQTIRYEHKGDEIICSDPTMLKHIILNLLSNAAKFSQDNGLIELYSNVKDNLVELVVKDYGIGISKQEHEHLFERFFRATNAMNIQGTGLGLHIVGRYLELINGNIECISELDKGTEFRITFNSQ